MFCTKCSNRLGAGELFCSNCGAHSQHSQVNIQSSKVDFFIEAYSKFFPREKLFSIRESLLQLPDDKVSNLDSSLDLKKPIAAFWLDFFLGGFGVARFYIGDVLNGFIRLGLLLLSVLMFLLAWAIGQPGLVAAFAIVPLIVWFVWIWVDLFLIMAATRKSNYKKLMDALQQHT